MYAQPQTARLGALEALSRGIPAELTVFVRKTYALLAFSLALGAAACWGMLQLMPTATVTLRSGQTAVIPNFPQWGTLLLGLGMLGFVLMGSRAKNGARQGEVSITGLVALVGMVVCSGTMLGPLIGTYLGLGMASTVGAAGIVTAVTFSALTALVFLTGRNFGFLGKFLFVALVAFVIARFVGMFIGTSAGFQWWMAAVGAVLFCGFILFDTSSVVHYYGPNNMVVPAVIALYLDILNLFLLLLQLLSSRNRN